MSYLANVVEIFLSCPDDVSSERDFILEVAAEWNRVRGREAACYISVITWREVVAPALSERAQDVINKQIGDDYDVYLGIMWTKFGTPTGNAQSGTEEEFNIALQRAKGGGDIRIATMFKVGNIDIGKVDALQLHKVQEFKKRVASEGAFYREFEDDSALRSAIFLLFEQIAKKAGDFRSFDHKDMASGSPLPSLTTEEVGDSEGLIEIGEEFQTTVALYVERLTIIREAENANTSVIAEASGELSAIVNPTSADLDFVKKNVKRVARSMDLLSQQYQKIAPEIEKDSDKIAYLIDADLRIRFEVDDWSNSGKENLEAAAVFSNALEEAIRQLNILLDITRGPPKLSGEVNRAKAKLTKERERVKSVLISLKQSIDSSIDFFKEKK